MQKFSQSEPWDFLFWYISPGNLWAIGVNTALTAYFHIDMVLKITHIIVFNAENEREDW